MRILLTGASGFVGHHVLDYLTKYTKHDVVCLVSFEHRGLSERLRFVAIGDIRRLQSRVKIIRHDLTAPIDWATDKAIGPIDVVMNIASESHVDRSISTPRPFIMNNVALMTTMLDWAVSRDRDGNPGIRMFLQMSTDEVYGPAAPGETGGHKEWSTILPSNPYSASKAAQEAIAIAYWRTYGVPVVITNTMNIFGPRQDAEKFPAMVMRNIANGETIPVHVSPDGKAIGSRFYLPAHDLADAYSFLVDNCIPNMYPDEDMPDRYNIVGEREVNNLEFVDMIAAEMRIPTSGYHVKQVDFHTSRPGHDLRYALDGTAMRALGWRAPMGLVDGIQDMVQWSNTPNGKFWNTRP